LLAFMAWLIVRLGNVWDDARTILLLVALLFMAVSVACDFSLADFDPRGVRSFRSGLINFLGGYLFAVLVSEGLLLSLRIRLPFWFRAPFHLFLALFFFYPPAIAPLLVDAWNRWLPWALFGFSPAAGLVMLTLLPAVRRGPEYLRGNGTPWAWPWFPWALFVVLGLAVALRHYSLCVSLHPVPGLASTFRPYFLVPFLLAANVVLLEGAITARRRGLQVVALCLPIGLLALAGYDGGMNFWHREFLSDFTHLTGGTPLFYTLVSIVVLHSVAGVRRVPLAADALTLSVAALSVVGPAAQGASGYTRPEPLMLLAAGIVQLYAAHRGRSTPRLFASACLALAAVTTHRYGTWFTDYYGAVPWHLLLAVVLVIGTVPNDRFARWLQYAGVFLFGALLAAWGLSISDRRMAPTWATTATIVSMGYPLAMAVLAAVYARLVGNRAYWIVAAAHFASWAAVTGWRGYGTARQALSGLGYLLGGAACFLFAAVISLLKTGLPQRWWTSKRPKPDTQL
ncbi:MAG TPA: hypothetical protein VJ783_15480, partial [Pirellulales bacterium]|nr:hypothetical protein [Pirellulales bacterium]